MQRPRVRLGQLLLDAHLISAQQLEQVLAFQKTDGRKLGVLLVESGFVTDTQLAQVLSQQLAVPWVSLHHIDFSRELLAKVPREVAEKYSLVPIYVRQVRGQGDTLYVAMEDPINDEALKDCAASSGLPTRPMIASPTDIRTAIQVYYQGVTSIVPAPPRPTVSKPPPVPSRPPPIVSKPPPIVSKPPPVPSKPPVSEPVPVSLTADAVLEEEPAEEEAANRSKKSEPAASGETARDAGAGEEKATRRRGGISLTLLDGTIISLPTRSKKRRKRASAIDELTAADVVAALRAAAHGADIKDVLGDARWEKVFAALLSLLLKKHLILDREFIDELKKI